MCITLAKLCEKIPPKAVEHWRQRLSWIYFLSILRRNQKEKGSNMKKATRFCWFCFVLTEALSPPGTHYRWTSHLPSPHPQSSIIGKSLWKGCLVQFYIFYWRFIISYLLFRIKLKKKKKTCLITCGSVSVWSSLKGNFSPCVFCTAGSSSKECFGCLYDYFPFWIWIKAKFAAHEGELQVNNSKSKAKPFMRFPCF